MKIFQMPEAAFYRELIDEMYDILLGYARLNISNAPEAQDIVQDVCLVAWEKIDRVMASLNPRGWLMNTLKNYICKYHTALADARRVTEFLDDIAADNVLLFDAADSEASFFSVLTPQEIRIVKLKGQGYLHREIAAFLELQPGTIDSAVSRIKVKIAKFLKTGS